MGIEVQGRAPPLCEADDAGLWVFVLGYGSEVVLVFLDLGGDDVVDASKELSVGVKPVTKWVGEGDDELPIGNYG